VCAVSPAASCNRHGPLTSSCLPQIARNIRTKSDSLISLSREEAAGPRSNRRRRVPQDDVRISTRTELRPPLRPLPRQPPFSDSKSPNSTQSRLILKTLHLDRRLTPLYSLMTPRTSLDP